MTKDFTERVARAIACADPDQQGQINESEMGNYFWEKYREHYLPMATAAILVFEREGDEIARQEKT